MTSDTNSVARADADDRPAAAGQCRFCGAPLMHVFADLGATPLANANVTPAGVANEKSYPLIVRVCGGCLLVQADDAVPPEHIFSDYDYFSSYSQSWVEHARGYAETMIDRLELGSRSLVVEVASNDGYLLQHFKSAGIPVLGIEPAANVAASAISKGIDTEVMFFGEKTASNIVARHGKANLTVANNVLAHVPDTRDFMAGFARILNDDGVATFEFPHVARLIEGLQFDTIYHEHFFYLSLATVEKIAASAGLRVFDVEELATHGGSLRLYLCHRHARHAQTANVDKIRRDEHAAQLDRIDGYLSFDARIARVREEFLAFLAGARSEGKIVAAYGAAAKGNTFLNYCGVTSRDIVAVFDRNPAKQGKLTPGSHIPIRAPADLAEIRPDLLIILPWNIADEIRASIDLSPWNGKFVVAIPTITVFQR